MPRLHWFIRLICSLLFGALALSAGAEDLTELDRNPTMRQNELWINVGAHSEHFGKKEGARDFNEDNLGLGFEYRTSNTYTYTLGYYNNSLDHPTHYAGVFYQPLQWGYARFGAVVGLMDGYPDMNNGNYFLAAMPAVSVEYKQVGVNLLFIPPLPQIVSAVAIQFKFKLN
ncbi:MAG: hypothetical protein ABL856_11695 [Gallionella sp.]